MASEQQGRATDRQLDEAHGFLVRCLITEIQEYRSGKVLDRHGRPQRCPTALYSELSKLLKVNAVDRPNREVDQEDTLIDELEQEFGEVDVPVMPSQGQPQSWIILKTTRMKRTRNISIQRCESFCKSLKVI